MCTTKFTLVAKSTKYALGDLKLSFDHNGRLLTACWQKLGNLLANHVGVNCVAVFAVAI